MTRRRAGTGTRRANQRAGQHARRPPPAGDRLPGTHVPANTGTSADTVEPEVLVVSHWFDPGEEGEPYSATVRFKGRRARVLGKPRTGDGFVHDEVVDHVVPGSGPVAITAWVYGLQPGEWSVSSELTRDSQGPTRFGRARLDTPAAPILVRPATWSWRHWAVSANPAHTVRTRWALLAPLARTPAVVPGIYAVLAVVGGVTALLVQSTILASEDVPLTGPLVASLVAIAAGLIAAKLWYAILHPDESTIRGGWAVDGFLVVAPLVAVAVLHAFALPMGTVLDASAPGIFFAVAIGRVGCFLAGCCAGRCTNSRWAIWSSDRRVGARRVPTQLLESAAGLGIAVVSLLLVLGQTLLVEGLVFVAASATYAVMRQGLLRLRDERRRSPRTLPLTAGAAAVMLLAIGVMSAAEYAAPQSHAANARTHRGGAGSSAALTAASSPP